MLKAITRIIASAFLAPMLIATQSFALEQEDLRGLASEEIMDRSRAIEKITEIGDAESVRILKGLQNGEIYFTEDELIVVEVEDGVADAVTLDLLDPEPDFYDTVVINNVLRSQLETAIGSLSLFSDDRGTRLTSALALEASPTAAMRPAIERALAKEGDEKIKNSLELSIALIDLESNETDKQLAAVAHLGDSNERRVRELLSAKYEAIKKADVATNVELLQVLKASVASIDQRLTLIDYFGRLFSGLSLGSILLLVALGLAITYGLLGVINLAHGEMLMIGAYATYMTQTLFTRFFPQWFDLYVLAAIPIAFLCAALVGMFLERTVIRWLYGRPLETLLATWGISLFLIQFVRQVFGAQNVEVSNPTWLSGGVDVMSVVLPYNRIAIIVFALLVLVSMWLVLSKTRLGLFIRAVTQNRGMASCVGVPTGRIDLLAFGLGSGIAGLAGVALSQIGNVGPDLGQSYIIDSFMVVVLGGVGQLAGSVYAALGLGVFSKIIEPHIGAVLTKIIILVFIIAVIQKRPQGLFALKGRSVES